MSINRGMDKEDVVHIYSGKLSVVKRNKIGLFAETWMDTEELYKKDLHDPDNHDGVITHLEPDILECEVKRALESITMNKANRRRQWHPTPVLLPGKSHGLRSLVGCSPWGR